MEQMYVKVERLTLVLQNLEGLIVKRYNGSIELVPQVAGRMLGQEIVTPPIPI